MPDNTSDTRYTSAPFVASTLDLIGILPDGSIFVPDSSAEPVVTGIAPAANGTAPDEAITLGGNPTDLPAGASLGQPAVSDTVTPIQLSSLDTDAANSTAPGSQAVAASGTEGLSGFVTPPPASLAAPASGASPATADTGPIAGSAVEILGVDDGAPANFAAALSARPLSPNPASGANFTANGPIDRITIPSGSDGEIAFISGVTSSATVAATSYWMWQGNNPATYGTTGSAVKWGNTTLSTSGTAGGNVTYWFDTASAWTVTEQTALASGLALWSAEANITFSLAASAAAAQVIFYRGTDGNAYEQFTNYTNATAGSGSDGQAIAAIISLDTSVAGFGPIGGSFDLYGGYPYQTLVHEEGHLIGLGHAGPYNGNVDSATQQFGVYDTRLWSLMSYIDPFDTNAKFYNSYPVTGTNWGNDPAGYYYEPTTPMILDILAAQRIYGVPTSTPLSGGQIFGFNTNITGAIKPYFDFTVNAHPVITIWDKGANNKLDVSGFSANATINLNPGTFSSVNGETNNIGIAEGTSIESAVGGPGSDIFIPNGVVKGTLTGGGGNDKFEGTQSGLDQYTISDISSGDIINFTDASIATFSFTFSGSTLSYGSLHITLSNSPIGGFTKSADSTAGIDLTFGPVACYCRGTLIRTDRGDVPVEVLGLGARLVTRSGETKPLKWVGQRSYVGWLAANNPKVMPVCFKRGSLADGVPRRELWVSPEHAMYLDGMLVPADLLVNGSSIIKAEAVDEVHYYHLELEEHDVILAEGAWAESFVDDDSRGMFHNAAEFYALYPEVGRPPARYCAPRVEDGFELEALRRKLASRAWRLQQDGTSAPAVLKGNLEVVTHDRISGWALDPAGPETPLALVVMANGAEIGRVTADRYRCDLETAGIGDGRHAFELVIPQGLTRDWGHRIEVCRADDATPLPGSPRLLATAAVA